MPAFTSDKRGSTLQVPRSKWNIRSNSTHILQSKKYRKGLPTGISHLRQLKVAQSRNFLQHTHKKRRGNLKRKEEPTAVVKENSFF